MPDLRHSVTAAIEASQLDHARAEQLTECKKRRLAWAEGRDTLYKFKSLAGESRLHVLDMIENTRIYFSSPDQFNDPLDCSPVCKLARDVTDLSFLEELGSDQDRMIAKHGFTKAEAEKLRVEGGIPAHAVPGAATESVRQVLRRATRVFCLSAEYDNPLLWSHYTNGHTGVCLHFSCRQGCLFGLAQGVICKDERLPILIPLSYNVDDDEIYNRMVLTKAACWGYEKEYRIIAPDDIELGFTLDRNFCAFEPRLLCGITLGMRISPADRGELVALMANRHPTVPVYQALENMDRFTVDVERLNS